jgi:hypothetical protein
MQYVEPGALVATLRSGMEGGVAKVLAAEEQQIFSANERRLGFGAFAAGMYRAIEISAQFGFVLPN